ncbi:MAG: hypothetical protein K1X72_28375, partial [Pyrinomonadaceae bacterium]|nr:hypothetical protein [Pyrinomonadaceae bacterium]
FSISVIAQTSCPTVSVIGPSQQIEIGGSMTFTAKVEGISLENLKYKWDISNGAITSGQGTQTITVSTANDMAGMTITAILEIIGLPQNCSKEFYGSGEIKQKIIVGTPIPIEEYNKISWSSEKIKLDEVVKILRNNYSSTLVFRIFLNTKNYQQTFKLKSARIIKYLTEKYKISNDRIRIVLEKNRENLTEVWLIPIGVTPPF